jgi:tripartite-type tricarboxylate transporter receptor subunit TctC
MPRTWTHPRFAAIACLVAATLASAGSGPVRAQTSPWNRERPVTIVVPYAPGGTVDAMARAVGKSITTAYGQPVVVENVPGAESLIGTRRVIDAKPDGYTLLIQVPAVTIIKHLPNLKGVDPLSGLAPVTSVIESPVLIVGSAKIPATTLKEFAAYCRKAAEPCSTGSGETLGRLRAQQIAVEADIPSMVNVNYRGTTPALTDLVGGNIQMSFVNVPSVLGHYRSGSVRILAVQDTKRSPQLPNVPTTVESGFPQFQMVSWFGLFAPRATPDPVLNAIAAALRKAKTDPDFQHTVENAGAVAVLNTPAQFAVQVKSEEKIWGDLVDKYPLQ